MSMTYYDHNDNVNFNENKRFIEETLEPIVSKYNEKLLKQAFLDTDDTIKMQSEIYSALGYNIDSISHDFT